MLKTIAAIAVGGFIMKRACPDTYNKAIQAMSDIVDTASDITTAARGQAKAYCAEAAADATARLQQVNPQAIEELRKLLGQSPPLPS